MPKRCLVPTLFLIFAVSLAAQNTPTPDFTGTWVLNIAKSSLAKDSTLKSETIEISNKKSSMIFHYKTDGKKSTETYIPDGQNRVAMDLGSSQLTQKSSWQGSALVVESILNIKIPNVTVTVTGLKPVVDKWTITPDGRTLSHETDDPKEVHVYDKQ